ncbi:MAG: heavy metal sensor histidine kinase [Gemmatimonadaceae bacterium]|nr:heavy metal sensor histidine kinase [Gemmatimonadaceae bacterium]
MRRPNWSLAARLSVWYASTAFLLVVGAALVQYRSLLTSLAAEDDLDLVERLQTEIHTGSSDPIALGDEREARMLVRVLDADCRPSRFASGWYPAPSCDSLSSADPRLRSWRSSDGTRWRVAGAKRPAPLSGWVEVLLDRSNDQRVVRAYREELFLVLVAALGLSAALGYLIARRGLRPLARLTHRIGEIDARSLERRLAGPPGPGGQPAEVATLVASFDGMLGRLEHAFHALTEFSGDLAHELRTPIHVLRQQAEIALQRARTPEEYREVLGSSLEELDRMRRMIDDILFLARAEDPRLVVQPARLHLQEEIQDVAEFLSADASERGVTLTTAVGSDLHLNADRTLFRRALVNVMANALRHTPAGGRVSVSARASADEVVVEVSDTGEGIPEELLPFVFERYVRSPSAKSRHPFGSGLGLTIVRGIMRLHGGAASISSTPGCGSCIALSFPRPSVNATDAFRNLEYAVPAETLPPIAGANLSKL